LAIWRARTCTTHVDSDTAWLGGAKAAAAPTWPWRARARFACAESYGSSSSNHWCNLPWRHTCGACLVPLEASCSMLVFLPSFGSPSNARFESYAQRPVGLGLLIAFDSPGSGAPIFLWSLFLGPLFCGSSSVRARPLPSGEASAEVTGDAAPPRRCGRRLTQNRSGFASGSRKGRAQRRGGNRRSCDPRGTWRGATNTPGS